MEPGSPPDAPAPLPAADAPAESAAEPLVQIALPPAPAPPPPPRSYWERLEPDDRRAWRITVYGLIARLVFVLGLHRPIWFNYSDMQGYIDRAQHLASPFYVSGPFEWFYPSGTSFVISIFLRLFTVRWGFEIAGLFQGVASGLEIYLVYLVAKRFFNSRVGLGAAVLFAAHYLSISYAGFFLSENYLSIGLIGACALLVPERPLRCLGAGLLLGFGAWAKSQAVLLAPAWALVLIVQRRYRSAAAVLLGTLAVVVPVSVFVSIRSGHRTFISNNGGQTFALAHCPIREIAYSDPATHSGAMFTVPVLNQRTDRAEVEASWGTAHYTEPFLNSAFYMHEGFECIRRYPKHALRMVLLHLVDTFAGPPWSNEIPWPDSHTGWFVPSLLSNLFVSYLVLPWALLGMWWNRRSAATWFLGIFPLLSTLATAVVFHGDPRFRAPYDFFLFILACQAWDQWRWRLPRG